MANKKKDKLEQWIAPAESISKNVKQTSGGANVTYTYSQPKKTSGTRIVGTGGTVAHTDAGAKRVAELANKKNPVVDSIVNSVSRGVGGLSTRKTTSTTKSNPASAFKPAPVMSKPKLTSSEKQKQNIDTLTKDLDELKQKRMNIRMKSAEGSSFSGLGAGMGTGNSAQLSEIDKKIKQKSDKLKKAENKYYGYGNGFFSDNAKRVGRVISGAAQSVAGTSVETVGQIGQLGSQNPELTSTIGGMISEELNPGTLKERQQATQGRIQKMFETSDTLASKSAANIESAKGGLGALGKVAVDVGSEGLKMASDMALNTVAPGTGLAALGVRAFGAGAQEARQAGATPDQQFMYGTATAAIELFTERVSSASLPFKQAYGKAMGIGGKTFDDALDAVLGKFIKNPAVRVFAHNFVGEWLEEDMSDLLNPVAKLIYDKDAVRNTYGTSEGRQQLMEDLLRDGFIGGILGSLGATGDVAVNTALGNRLLKNGGAANVMATAASFPEQSEAHQSATEMIERHDNGGKVSAYEVGSLVQKMKEAAAHGVYPDDSVGTYEVVRDARGNWQVVHQINETAQALNEKGIDTKEAIAYAAVLDSLAKDDNLTANQIKRKLDVFNLAVREQIEEMTGRVLPEPTTKSETARAIKAAFDSYREEVAEAERIAEEERQAAAEAQIEEEEAAIAEESAAEAEEYLGQAVAETEQAQAEQQPARQPRESREAFFERKKAEGMNRYGVEPSDEQIESAWRAATEEDGVLLDDGTVIGRAEFYEVMRPYLSKEEGYELSDEQMEAAYNRFRAISDSRPMPRAAWNASVAATRGESASAETESATAEETAAEEVTEAADETAEAAEETGATVMAAAEESAPAEEQAPAPEPKKTAKKSAKKTPARKTVIPTKAQAVAKSATTESTPAAEEEVPYAEQPNEPHRNPMSPFAEKNAEKVARNSEKQREEVASAQKKQTQQAKTSQKKQTVIPTKAEAEAAKTATQSAETAEKVGGSAESIQNAIKTLRESGAKTQRDVFDSTGKSAKESVRLSQAYWLLQDNGLISVKSDGSFTIKNTAKNGGVKHSLSTQSKNPNIQTNERVTLEQRLAAEFLLPRLSKKGIKRIVFDGKNMEGENGHIDKKTGTIYLNENYLDTAMAVAQTVGHEIFHAGVEGDANLVNSMLESAKKLVDDGKLMGRDGRKAARWLKDIDAEVERRAADYREFLENAGADEATIAEETSPEAMREEIACDLMGMVLGSQNAIDTIAADNPTLLDKIVDAIDRLLGGRITAMANAATGGGDTSFARYGKEYASTVKELDKIAERLSTALDNYRDGTRVVEPSELENSDARTLAEDMGEGTVVEADENGDLVFAQNKAEHSTAFSLATWQVGQAKLRRALEEEGHDPDEINDIINRIDSIAEFIEDLGDEYAEMGYDKLKNNLIADIVTDVRTGKQVLSALVKNGDYPVNFDLALICKKRVAYMNLISRLVKDGVMDKVTFGAEAIAKVNEILRDRGFETACLGCFVESRRLQIQKWAETIVKEWNEEVDKRTKNAPDFGFAQGKNAELTVDDLATIRREYESEDVTLNNRGNVNLEQGSVKKKMGQLLDEVPSLLQHLTIEDLLTPQGISALRQRDGSLFSLVQQRYGAASPKIVQDFNPYNGEIADLSFEFVKDRLGDGIKGKDAYIANAKAELAVEEGGLPAKQKGESKADFEKRKADFDARAENMAIRQYLYDIGGARIQSFSDFMIENVFDYVQIYADLAARKFPMHGYTKEIIALRLFGLTGQKWNGSLIAHTERSQGKELAGLLPVEEAKNGHGIVVTDPYTGKQYAICFDDYQRNKRTKGTDQESFIQSIGMKDIFALQLDSRYSPFVGSITIGVSDAQIRAMLNHPLFSMVIPYHKSGMLPMYAELVGVDMYNDYTDYQNTRVGAVYGKDGKPLTRAVDLDGNPIPPKTVRGKKVDYAPGIYKKDGDGWKRVSADTSFDFNAVVNVFKDAKEAADFYIEWCQEEHPIYSGGEIVGYETFLPKFSDSPEGYDFTQEENYYKLLEDFVSYDTVTGEPVLQGDVQMNFPEADSLSADELDAYKQRLRDTGLYTEKEIERYAEKAQMGFKDIVREALDERKQYHDTTDPQWEDTVSQVKDALLGDDHLRSTPAERQKAWAKEDKAAKKAAKQKGIKHSLPTDTKQMDEEYMAAVESGDTARAQRMVDEAAKKAGYTVRAYHGTPYRFNEFLKSKIGKTTDYGWFGRGFYFTTDKSVADVYAGYLNDSNVIEAYLSVHNPFVFSEYPGANDKSAGDIMNEVLGIRKKNSEMTEGEKAERSADFSDWLVENGYDGAKIWSQIMILDSEQAKRANVITYGDDGNIIPLSERFNPEQSDIRYSLSIPEMTESIEADEEKLRGVQSKYRSLEEQIAAMEQDDVYQNLLDSIGKVGKDELQKLVDEYNDWGKSSGYFDLIEQRGALSSELSSLQTSLSKTRRERLQAQREEYRKKYTPEFAAKYAAKAARRFGTTSRFDLAGYLTTNGSLLDFSEGQGQRVEDHRGISEVLDFLPDEHEYSDGMIEFMNLGNIRLQTYGIDIAQMPNAKQIPVLRKFFNSLNGEVTVDLSREDGSTVGSIEYPEGTIADRIFADLKRYFEDGIVPEVSTTQRFFKYSLRGEDQSAEDSVPMYGESADPADVAVVTGDRRKYSVHETDPDTLKWLNEQVKNGDYVRTYKTFLEVRDGNRVLLYPPMATKQRDKDGKLRMANVMELNTWEKSVGNPDSKNIVSKRGKDGKTKWYYRLVKDNGKTVDAAYDPYQHSSDVVLNDQFESAYQRPNLVTYECWIPKSELTSGYHYKQARSDGQVVEAALPVGKHQWKKGTVAGKLKNTERSVYLSRWLMPVRRLDDSEVAQKYKEILDKEENPPAIPFNVVPPGLLSELEKIGVPINYEGSPMYRARNNKERTKKPVDAFTEKGRKYSVRGQVPEFDAIFDQYMAKITGEQRDEYLQQNPPVQRKSQTNSTNPLLTDDQKKKARLLPEDRTHTVVTNSGMSQIVGNRLENDEVGEKRRLFRKGKKWDATDLATAEEIIRREVEKAKETDDYSEARRLIRMHDAQMSDWGLAGHTARDFGSSFAGIVSDATETLDESVEQEPRNQKKKATAQKVTESVGNAGRAAAKQVRKEIGNAAGENDGKPTIPDKKTFEKNKQRRGKKAVEIEGNMAGEPFTFEYSDAVGTAIGKSLMSALNQKQRAKTFLEEMQSHIKRFASEKMPKRGSKAPTTPTELLREYVQNQRFYEEAWANAQDEVRRQLEKKGIEEIPEELEGFLGGWYGVDANGNPQNKILRAAIAHSALSTKETADKIRKQAALGARNIADIIADDLIRETGAKGEIAWTIKKAAQFYVDDVLAKPVTTKDGKAAYDVTQQTKVLDNMVASALAEIGKAIDAKKGPSSMQRLGSTSAAYKADIRDAVIATLTLQYAVSEEDAENVARIVSDRFDVLLKEGMNKRLANMFKDREAPSAQAKKAFLDRVVELTNLGAFESADYHDAAVAKLLGGYQTRRGVTTDEVLKKVYDYATRLDDIKKGDTKALKDIVSDLNAERWTGGMVKGDEIHKTLQKIINYVASQPDGADFLRDLAAAQIRGIANDHARISAVDAINAERYLAMLSKLTTVARNIVGNTAFDLVETISNNTATTPIDALMYLRTKRRTATWDKSYLGEAKGKGAVDGFLRSVIEIALDAPIDDGIDKWEMRNGRTYKMAKANNPNAVKKTANVAENLMSTWEKWQKYLLVATDEFAKGGTRAERQRQLDVLRSKGLLGEDELLEDADEVARERTFQNQGKMTKIMGGLRNVGNVIGFNDSHGNRVGLGTALMPFANVPANIAGQALNYSPLGFIKGAIEVEEVMRKGKRATAEEQAKAARDFGRGVNGTALITLFTMAALKGLLTVSGSSGDRDEDALKRDEGLSGTQFNISAFVRWVKGESTKRKKDDVLVNVGGLEPINAPMAFGAFLADSYNEDGTLASKVANASFESLFQTLKDLPAMSQISSIADAYKYSDEKKSENNPDGGPWKQAADAAAQGISDIATSGVPNFLTGIAQGMDKGVYRTPQTSDKRGLDAIPENTLNAFKMKIPGLRSTLPEALDSYGKPRKSTASTAQNWLNSNLLPFAINSFQPNPVSEELLRLRDAGVKVTLPARNAIKTVNTKSGESKKLTESERRKYQQTQGGLKYDTMLEAMNTRSYSNESDEFRAKVWADVASYANAKGKLAVGGTAEVPTWSEKGSGSIADRAINHAYYLRMNDVLPQSGTTTGRKMQELIKYANGNDQMARDLFAQLLDNNQDRGTLKKIDYLHTKTEYGGGGGYSYDQIAKFYNAKNEKSEQFGLDKNGNPKSRTKDALIAWATQNGFTRDQALWLYKVFNGDVDIP